MIGPVLTPEAILIRLIERLQSGTHGAKSVNIIDIFEECLEHLVSNLLQQRPTCNSPIKQEVDIRNRASRRLLQKVNSFQEEISIVSDVLSQQLKVLQGLSDYLDPLSFRNPSIARKMRFEYEVRGIEKIMLFIREQLNDCRELMKKARVLATHNVQLVESLQDDNNRAIFTFTFITVLFLPLTFVAGFFGMNLAGISDTHRTAASFWYIGFPLTAGIMGICAVIILR